MKRALKKPLLGQRINNMQKILVTGGAGFIGAHVAKKLLELGHEVVIVDNLNDYYNPQLKRDRLKQMLAGFSYDFVEADIVRYEQLEEIFKKHKFSAVCHLAAQAGVRWSLENLWVYAETNILGTLNILESARKYKTEKIVFASSSSVYGLNEKMPYHEDDRVDSPASLYAATKKSAELLAHSYHQLYGLKICALRFFTVYGPWGRPDMAYFKWADLITAGKPIDVYNHGMMKRDFAYIDDIVDGVAAALESDFTFEIINLGNDRPEELPKLIELLENNLGLKAEKNYLPMQPGDVANTWADISKARKLLNYQPKTSLEQGIAEFAKWHKEYYKI